MSTYVYTYIYYIQLYKKLLNWYDTFWPDFSIYG